MSPGILRFLYGLVLQVYAVGQAMGIIPALKPSFFENRDWGFLSSWTSNSWLLTPLIGWLTRDKMLQFATGLMGYFDKVGELGDPSEANDILGAPRITLDQWI